MGQKDKERFLKRKTDRKKMDRECARQRNADRQGRCVHGTNGTVASPTLVQNMSSDNVMLSKDEYEYECKLSGSRGVSRSTR